MTRFNKIRSLGGRVRQGAKALQERVPSLRKKQEEPVVTEPEPTPEPTPEPEPQSRWQKFITSVTELKTELALTGALFVAAFSMTALVISMTGHQFQAGFNWSTETLSLSVTAWSTLVSLLTLRICLDRLKIFFRLSPIAICITTAGIYVASFYLFGPTSAIAVTAVTFAAVVIAFSILIDLIVEWTLGILGAILLVLLFPVVILIWLVMKFLIEIIIESIFS